MAQTQKPDFVFWRNGRVYLNRQGSQFSRLLAAEVCAPAVVMPDTPCSEVVRRVLATHSIRQFPIHFPNGASPCTITFQLDSTTAVTFLGGGGRKRKKCVPLQAFGKKFHICTRNKSRAQCKYYLVLLLVCRYCILSVGVSLMSGKM
jgi:hypothetical protein